MGKLKEVLGWTTEQLDAFKTICEQTEDFNESYDNFAGAPEGYDSKVRYIFKLDTESDSSNEKPAESTETSQSSEASSKD